MTLNYLDRLAHASKIVREHAKLEGRGSRRRCGYCADARDKIADHADEMSGLIRDGIAAA
jgi:hypothetical protein